jgi:hypothetical protein
MNVLCDGLPANGGRVQRMTLFASGSPEAALGNDVGLSI